MYYYIWESTHIGVYIHMQIYVYLLICGGHKRPDILQNHNTDKYGNIIIILVQALFTIKMHAYIYVYLHFSNFKLLI